MEKFTKALTVPALMIVLSIAASSCLKTRAQLKEDDDTPATGTGKPVANPVQNVEPQGGYAIDEMKGEMTRMEGRIEDLERTQKQDASAQTSSSNKEEIKKLEARMTEMESAQAQIIEQLKKNQEVAAAAAVNPDDLYDKGMNQLETGNSEAAISTFSSYLKNGKGKKTEDVTFYRGEAYFNLKQYKQAIVDYSKFPEKYTKSPHMPEALYKIGESFDALGMKDDAKGFYQELVDKFPKSKQAKKVKGKLK
jgi:tol-pal system protein YbgF